MSETPQNTPTMALTIEQKQANWSKFATKVHDTELRLQATKEALIKQLKDIPYDSAKIEGYEIILKNARASENALIEDRKTVTKVLDGLSARLMMPEKELASARGVYETGLLQVKKTKRDNDAVIAAKASEVARVKEFYSNSIAQQHAAFESAIVNKVSKAFEQALTKKLDSTAVAEIWPKIKELLTQANFITTQAEVSVVYMKPEDVTAIFTSLHAKNAKAPMVYVEKWHKMLFEKFEMYDIAFKNSEASLVQTKQDQATALNNIADEAADAVVAAKLDAISAPTDAAVLIGGGRALKQVFKLDMEETEQSVITIIAAFAANWSQAKEQLGVRKWFKLSVDQMGGALVTLKNKDNAFEVSGIKFALIDKLR